MKESQFSKEVVKYLKDKGALVNVNTANMFDKVGRFEYEGEEKPGRTPTKYDSVFRVEYIVSIVKIIE